MKSRYEDIKTEITDMKELIQAINKRFDQQYKQIQQLDEKVGAVHKDVKSLKSDITEIKKLLKK